jgi:aspartate racemase
MKTIGLLGGMSWESSLEYERTINEYVRDQLGGSSSASLIIRSYNFSEIHALQEAGGWEAAGARLAADAALLEGSGAEIIILCTNTMHRLADQIRAAISIPFLHIADATANRIIEAGERKVGLLGTRFTMEDDFYVGHLEAHGLEVLVPGAEDRTIVHDVIYKELVRGVVSTESRAQFSRIADTLIARGAEAIIAGCTEIELLLQPADVSVSYYPTARIHAEAAARVALE